MEQLSQSGVTISTDGWDACYAMYLCARGISFNPDGSLCYQDVAAEDLTRKVQAVHHEVA